MRRVSATLLVLVLGVCSSTYAQQKDRLALGVIIGEPTGLSLKKWIGNNHVIDAGIAWSFSENNSLHLHVDYLFHRFDLLSRAKAEGHLPLYFGLGVRVKLKENNGKGRNEGDGLLGVRMPLGISYLFADAPIELFAEIVPVLDVAPDTDFNLNAAVGARFYFWD